MTTQQFNPSLVLVAYVTTDQSSKTMAEDMIRNAVLGLFNTIATSVRDSGKVPPYALAEGGKFANSIAKALLFRVPVGV